MPAYRQTEQRRDTRLRVASDRLIEATDPDKILLFGSCARGDHHEGSDYDVFVLVPDTLPFGRKTPFWLWHLMKDVGLPIDVLMRQTALFKRRKHMANTIESAVSQDGVALYGANAPLERRTRRRAHPNGRGRHRIRENPPRHEAAGPCLSCGARR